MNVKLLSYSKATDEFQTEGLTDLQELIAFCAKVSNPAAQINTETSERLIKYLIKHQHWSPLEMVNAVLEINTTRDIAHQIVRHRSFAFQEFSQRYADPAAMGFPYELRETRLQDETNRQNSVETNDELLNKHWIQQQKRVMDVADGVYKWAIGVGIAKEQARAVLPEGLTKSRLYMAGTLRSWIHYVDVRTTPGTQKEHLEIARQCGQIIEPFFPMMKDFVHE